MSPTAANMRRSHSISSDPMPGIFLPTCNLPGDVTEYILSKLPAKSLIRFKSVCKTWSALIENPNFTQLHLDQAKSNPSYHKLLAVGGESLTCISNRKWPQHLHYSETFLLPIPKLYGFGLFIGSCDGLICITALSSSVSVTNRKIFIFWNPIMKQFKTVPEREVNKNDYNTPIRTFGFGYNHSDGDYKLVEIRNHIRHTNCKSTAYIYSLKYDRWRYLGFVVPGSTMCEKDSALLMANGVLNWMASIELSGEPHRRCALSFDVRCENFQLMMLPEPVAPYDTKINEIKLGLSKGNLAVMANFVGIGGNEHVVIWVMTIYGAEHSWFKQLDCEPDQNVARPLGSWHQYAGHESIIMTDASEIKCGRLLVWYDTHTGEAKDILKCENGIEHTYGLHSYVESLVPIKGGSKY